MVLSRAAWRDSSRRRPVSTRTASASRITWFKRVVDYRRLADAFAAGTPDGLREWLLFCCEALEAGAAEAKSIADAARGK